MSTSNWKQARKSYLTSLRSRLKKAYNEEAAHASISDKRWLNGFMAAGFHSGLITLKELKLESMSAYRKIEGKKMDSRKEARLEQRLLNLSAR